MLLHASNFKTNRPGGSVVLNRASAQADGLVRLWPLNGDRRQLVGEMSVTTPTFGGSGAAKFRPVSLGGLAFDPSVASGAFDTGDQIQNLCPSSSGTIAVWIFPLRAFNNGADEFILSQNGGTTNGLELRRYGPFTQWFGGFYNGSDMRAQPTATAANWLQNMWQLITLTWVTGATAILYNNGLDLGNHSVTLTAGSPTGNLAIAGSAPADTTTNFSGYIAHTAIWNRALNPAQVWQLYDPATRWDLYWTPSSRVFFNLGGAAPATAYKTEGRRPHPYKPGSARVR